MTGFTGHLSVDGLVKKAPPFSKVAEDWWQIGVLALGPALP